MTTSASARSVPWVGLEIGDCREHQHQSDTIGDRVVQFQDECSATVGQSGEDAQLPQRSRPVERLTDPVLGVGEHVAAFGEPPRSS